jgi:hypothetical protein
MACKTTPHNSCKQTFKKEIKNRVAEKAMDSRIRETSRRVQPVERLQLIKCFEACGRGGTCSYCRDMGRLY